MKKKAIRITVITILLLALISGVIYWCRLPKAINEKITKDDILYAVKTFNINNIERNTFSNNIKKYSKKYNLFDEIYNSNNLIFVYGYEKGSRKENTSEKFHKTIQKNIKEKNLDKKYNIIIITNPQKTVQEVAKKNNLGLEKATKGCDLKSSNDTGVLEIIDTTSTCYYGVCIMNPKKNEYITFPKRFPEIIIKALEDYEG